MDKIELWKFIAGLGFFLFGMMRMEEALKELAGRSFKRFLRQYTTNPLLGIINGAFTTAILQSSSVVTLMVLAFVGAEIITLGNALGIVLGANLGTTFTGWVVASLGFKMNLESFVLPLIGIGCCGLVFLGSRFRFYYFLAFMAGLGFLFLGLDFMKESMTSLSQSVDLSFLEGWGGFAYLLFGAGFTALIQSSSATMMIALSALHADLVTLPYAAALVIGADLGTTVTALIGSAGGTPTKKRVGMAHFLFNLITDLLAFALLTPLLSLLQKGMSLQNPLYTLVAFHSSFNVLGIVLFLPFLKLFERYLKSLFEDDDQHACKYIHQVGVEVPDAALETAKKDLNRLSKKVFSYKSSLLGLKHPEQTAESLGLWALVLNPQDSSQDYEKIKQTEGELLAYFHALQKQKIDDEDSALLHQYILALRHSVQAAKAAKDIQHNLKQFEQSVSDDVESLEEELQKDYNPVQEELMQIWKIEDQQTLFETLARLFASNERAYKKVNDWIYNEAGHKQTFITAAATFLNVNREIFSSNRYLLQALKDILLPAAESQVFTNLPQA